MDVCPTCGARGEVEGLALEVVPELIRCGFCQQTFEYRANAWDIIRKDYDGELDTAFRLRVHIPGDAEKARPAPKAEGRNPGLLTRVPTKMLLHAYRAARRGDSVSPMATITWDGSGMIGRMGWSGAEVKTELDTREHRTSKRERRKS